MNAPLQTQADISYRLALDVLLNFVAFFLSNLENSKLLTEQEDCVYVMVSLILKRDKSRKDSGTLYLPSLFPSEVFCCWFFFLSEVEKKEKAK